MGNGASDKRRSREEDEFSDVESEKDSFGEDDRLVAAELEKDGQPMVQGVHVDGASSSAGSSKILPRGLKVKTDKSQKKEYVGWMDLPRKGQLIVLTLARLSEPLVQTSLQVCASPQLPPRAPSPSPIKC